MSSNMIRAFRTNAVRAFCRNNVKYRNFGLAGVDTEAARNPPPWLIDSTTPIRPNCFSQFKPADVWMPTMSTTRMQQSNAKGTATIRTDASVILESPQSVSVLRPLSLGVPEGDIESWEASSTLKKRRLKMNRHKYRKRRKRDRRRSK